jgi:hypothetical protein
MTGCYHRESVVYFLFCPGKLSEKEINFFDYSILKCKLLRNTAFSFNASSLFHCFIPDKHKSSISYIVMKAKTESLSLLL